MYYDDEPYYEPSLADEILNEYQQKMKDALLDSIKYQIEKTKKENQNIKDENIKLRQQVNEISNRERELEIQKKNLAYTVRHERLSELMKDFEVIMYRAYTTTKKLPKCDKCNKNRQIEFTSPTGKKMTEDCSCDKGKIVFIPQEYICTEFKIERDSNRMAVWYKMHQERDYDYCSYDSSDYVDTVYNEGMKYEDLKDYYKVYFKSKEECQKYCCWLNKQKGVEDIYDISQDECEDNDIIPKKKFKKIL